MIFPHSSDKQTLIDTFPGRATICSPEEEYLEGVRSWWKGVYVEEGMGLKPWDTVQLRLRDDQPGVEGQAAVTTSEERQVLVLNLLF